jgi:PAS domain S-box-containing protein
LKKNHEADIRKLEEKILQLQEANQILKADLAQRQQTETTLRRLAEGFSSAQSIGNIGSWETNLASNVVEWSDQTHRIFETDPESYLPTHEKFLSLVHPEDRDAVDLAFKNSLHHTNSASISHRIVLPDGRVKYVEERWRIYQDDKGKSVRAIGSCHDVTERKIAENILYESEERFRQLAENSHEVFWITDCEKKQVLYISPAYEKVWGRTCESLYQSPHQWMDCIHPEDRERVKQAAITSQSTGEYQETYRVTRPNGDIRWIFDRAYPVTNEKGEVYRIVGTAEDITERKKLESQFLRAQRMESIGTLAGGIAHDLNNVLAPVLLSIQLLKTKVHDPEGLSMLDTIQSCTERGASLVKQVLTFARGIEGQRIAVNIRYLIEDIHKIIQETFPKNIAFRSYAPHKLWTVLGDPTQIHQVLMNLCVNARDAMPKGGTLTVKIDNVEIDEVYANLNPDTQPGFYLMVTVSDTGFGIPPENKDRIFEPFFTTKEIGSGTGLGLSTSSAIVKSHGGFINVYSEMNKGAEFKIYFPAQAGQVKDVGSAPENPELPRGEGQTVLVVDDEKSVRSIVQKTLERFGYRVILAMHGAEGVSLYAQQGRSIDVVISDVAMPIMDGPAMILALRSINPSVRVICSSGLEDNALMALNASGGKIEFVRKPYTAESLLKALKTTLSR